MLTKIVHGADFHVPLYKDHEKYKAHIIKFLDHCARIMPDRIILAGDLFHCKNALSPEQISLVHMLIEGCAERCNKVIVLIGNHDFLENNLERKDALSTVVEIMKNPKVVYFKNSCVYPDANVLWCIYGLMDGNRRPEIPTDTDKLKIGLFHGQVDGLTTALGWSFKGTITTDHFTGLDAVLCGDIHKHQVLFHGNAPIVQAGSFMQHSFGETVEGHGFVEWDLPSFDYKLVHIDNPYEYYQFYVNDVDNLDDITPINFELINFKPAPEASLRAVWKEMGHNQSEEKERRIEAYYKHKFGCKNVTVDAVRVGSDGQPVTLSHSDAVFDPAQTRETIAEWLEENKIMVDLDRVMALDTKVTGKLPQGTVTDGKFRKVGIKRIEFSNFLCFGDDNYIDYDRLRGVTVVQSNPKNYGGKTVAVVDLFLFLFFGETTKTERAEQIFNIFRDDCNEVSVRGWINIENADYMITRTITRKRKRNGEYTVSQDLDYIELNEDGTPKKNLEGEQRRETEKLIASTFGTYKDFLITVVATADNLNDLLNMKQTEKGNLLSRFIGLDVLQLKEKAAKTMHTEWFNASASRQFDKAKLVADITTYENEINENTATAEGCDVSIAECDASILQTEALRTAALSGKRPVDASLEKKSLVDLESATEKDKMAWEKVVREHELAVAENDAFVLTEPFDDEVFERISEEERTGFSELTGIQVKINNKNATLVELRKGRNCPTCGKDMDGFDTARLTALENEIKELAEEHRLKKTAVDVLSSQLVALKQVKQKHKEKEALGLKVDRLHLQAQNAENTYRATLQKVEQYKANLDNIEHNRVLEGEIIQHQYTLNRLRETRDGKIKLKHTLVSRNDDLRKRLIENKHLVDKIKGEESIDAIFKLYIQMMGRNGICKTILRRAIPDLNSTTNRLLRGATEFDIQLALNENFELEFNMKDRGTGKVKPLSSGSGYERTTGLVALRAALANLSVLPKPDVLVLDEVFSGPVADENFPRLDGLMRNMKEMFNKIFVISHNKMALDWSDFSVTVVKEENVSRLKIGTAVGGADPLTPATETSSATANVMV